MAVTVQELITRINNHFDDQNNDVYPLAVKISWVDVAQKDLAWRLSVEFLQELVKTEKQNTTVATNGSVFYDLPTTFLKMIEVLYFGIPCKVISLKQRQSIGKSMDSSPTENEPMAIIRGGKIEVFPSGTAGENKLEIIFIKQLDTLTEISNPFQLPNFVEAIFYYALSQAYAKDNQPEVDKYLNLYIGVIAGLMGVK